MYDAVDLFVSKRRIENAPGLSRRLSFELFVSVRRQGDVRLGVLAGKLCRIAWDWVALNQVTRFAIRMSVSLKQSHTAVQEFNGQVTRHAIRMSV